MTTDPKKILDMIESVDKDDTKTLDEIDFQTAIFLGFKNVEKCPLLLEFGCCQNHSLRTNDDGKPECEVPMALNRLLLTLLLCSLTAKKCGVKSMTGQSGGNIQYLLKDQRRKRK